MVYSCLAIIDRDDAPLIKPSYNRLDVEAEMGFPAKRSSYTLELFMSKNETADWLAALLGSFDY
jgi:hypothetical protein